MSILMCCVLLVVFGACEECRDRAGKEQIQINQSGAVIESIALDNAFKFSKSETANTSFYSTGWVNIDKATLEITVHSRAVATSLSFEVKDDRFLHITLADTTENFCATAQPGKAWETFRKNNIEVCLYYEEVPCP